MHLFANNFSRWHVGILLAVWLTFTALTCYIVSQGLSDAREQPMTVVVTTAASVLGPMTGAICRGFQSCCLAFSLALLPYCLSALAAATLVQVIRLPDMAWLRVVCLVVWTLGLIVWFGGGIVSLVGHALT